MDGYKYINGSSNDNIAIRDDKYFGELLNKKFPNTTDYTKWECFGFVKNGKPLVAWCYHSYSGVNNNLRKNYEAEITITSYSKLWATKHKISQILALFFERPCYNRLTVLTHSSNRQAVKLSKLAGFILEGIIRQPADKEDILQFSMLREDWQQGKFYGFFR